MIESMNGGGFLNLIGEEAYKTWMNCPIIHNSGIFQVVRVNVPLPPRRKDPVK
jgi:hypothetical protein